MADVHKPEVRSYNMSRIKNKNTTPEIILRSYLHRQGFRFRLHDKKLPGKPDIVLRRYNAVVFVHGCFWHGHEGCKYYVVPKTRTQWWLDKISGNKANDEKSVRALREQGWKVIIVWECELKKAKRDATLQRVAEQIKL